MTLSQINMSNRIVKQYRTMATEAEKVLNFQETCVSIAPSIVVPLFWYAPTPVFSKRLKTGLTSGHVNILILFVLK